VRAMNTFAVSPGRLALPMSVSQPRDVPPSDGSLLPRTRRGVALLLFLAAANAVFLYIVPHQAAFHYAWSIAPSASAAFLGAGYLAGCVATGLVVFYATRWRSLSMLAPALWVLAISLLGATLLHTDKFKFGYPPTWVWIAVYALVPFGIPILVIRQRRVAGEAPERDPALNGVRIASLILGGAILLASIALFMQPARLGHHWPWHLTPLLAQVVASWYAMIAVALIACGLTLRDRTEALIPYATLASWSLAVMALAVLYPSDVQSSGTTFFIWLAVMVALLALSVAALIRAAPAVRSA
jgi:MFS family permease